MRRLCFPCAHRRDLFDHIQTLSLRFYDRQPIGELMSRVVNDTDAIDRFLSNGITQFLQSTFNLLGVVVAMLLLNIPMSMAVLAVVPLMAGALALSFPPSRRSGGMITPP